MRIELVTLKEERAGGETKVKNLESLLAAERRTRAEEEDRVKNLSRINGMLLMQVFPIFVSLKSSVRIKSSASDCSNSFPTKSKVRSLTKELDSFSLAAKSGENPFETKSYDDGFQSAHSFFSGGSQSHLDDQSAVPSRSNTGLGLSVPATAAPPSIPSSASFPPNDTGKQRRGNSASRPNDGLAVSEAMDANLYELHGDASPDSGLQSSLG